MFLPRFQINKDSSESTMELVLPVFSKLCRVNIMKVDNVIKNDSRSIYIISKSICIAFWSNIGSHANATYIFVELNINIQIL